MMDLQPVDRDVLAARIDRVHQRVHVAATRAGRSGDDITVVAVSKTFPREAIDAAYALGLSVFGENRVQEAAAKFQDPLPSDVRLHLIGQLQTNKVKAAVGVFDRIESVDRSSLVAALEKEAARADTLVRVLMQVNIGREPQKAGCDPDATLDLLDRLRASDHLRVDGLMAIIPMVGQPDAARAWFRAVRELRDDLQRQRPDVDLSLLSMGMSGDFEAAIAEGATHVRIGSAIFGAR